MSTIRIAAVAAALLALSAAPALAHPKLVSSMPAAKATVGPTAKIELHFSEPLEAKFSGADLTETSMMMNGQMMAHVMKIGGVAAALDPADHKTLILSLKKPLAPGAYKVSWHAVSTDTHRLTGAYAFTVR
jgi:methionine-rich copper-binding protein CopC